MIASILTISLLAVIAMTGLVWTSRHLMVNKERRTGFMLTEDYLAGPVKNPEMISMMVAAKDEEACIGACVSSLLKQDYPNFEVIVCNDRSTDRTRQIVEDIARTDSRLRLINIESLPDGWFGKNNAMQTGIKTARGSYICMTDADCRFLSPRMLSVAMQYARQTGSDLLSVLPVLEMKGFWENVVQPVCSGVMMIWFHPDKVNDPAQPHAYANGAFMLMKRSAYEKIGTHAATKDLLNEDMAIAALTKRHGLRLTVVRNSGLYLVRMYTSLEGIIKGWSRIFLGTFGTLRRLTISLTVLVVMGLLPYAAAIAGLSVAASGSSSGGLWPAIGIVGLAVAAMQISVIYRFYRLIGARKDLAWSYPLGCLVAIWAVILSLTKLRKGAKVVWRSTSYPTANQA